MAQSISDSSPVVKKLKQACLPFKPCSTPSPVTPVSSSAGKKRRVAPSNSGTRFAAKNLKVESKKAIEKPMENLSSDDKVVSSSCEVECSNAVSLSTSTKAIPSRSSLDYFVHTTQKLEVTTSSMDGDLVDLTAEEDAEFEAVALSGTCTPIEVDVTPAFVSDDHAAKLSTPVATKCDADTGTPVTCSPAAVAGEMEGEANAKISKDCSDDTELQSRQCENDQKPACATSSACSTVHVLDDGQKLDTQAIITIQNVSSDNDGAVQNMAECVGESPLNKSSSSDDNDEMDIEESPACENVDDKDQLCQAAVVLVKLTEEDIKTASDSEKSCISTTTSANANAADNKVATNVNQKPKKISREEKQRLKEEREKQRLLAKERREKERLDAKIQKENERVEKQKEKDQKKKEKEEERLRKLELLEEDRKKKQEMKAEEKKKKEEIKAEEKKKKEEKKTLQENKQDCLRDLQHKSTEVMERFQFTKTVLILLEPVLVKEKQLMQKFFIAPKESAAVKPQEVKTGPFMDFEVKKDMRIAPRCRIPDLDATNMMKCLDEHLVNQEVDLLYTSEMKRGLHRPRTYVRTWPSREASVGHDLIMLPSCDYAGSFMHAKLLQFHENYRPAYYGTWRKHSSIITARRPWQQDTNFFAYDVDSDEEWEEEEPGESLSHSEGEEDEENDGEQDDDADEGFFVPHGYLSEGEGCDDDGDEGKISPEKMKDQLLAKMRNFEAEVLSRKCDVLQPVAIGVSWWSPDTELDLPDKKLQDFQVMLFEEAPFETQWTMSEEQPVKKKVAKETKGKNVTFIPVPDSGLPDLARLVHGNSRSIQKLVREFCEYWRRKTLPDTADGDGGSDENAPVVKVSKRKTEAKIREIAVYEFRPQCHKHKLWYLNDKTIEKLNLSLPVPTEWKWITLVSTKGTQENTTAKQPTGVCSVQPSPTNTSGSIKSFMSSVTPGGSQQQSPAANGVTMTKALCGVGQSPSQALQQSPSVSTSGVEPVNSASPLLTSVASDNGADGTKPARPNPVRPASTPCSSMSAGKKRKVQSVRRNSLSTKSQPCLLFSKKPRQLPVAATIEGDDDDCMGVNSCSVNEPNAAKSDGNLGRVDDASNGDPSTIITAKPAAQQYADDDDCMIIDSCDSEHGNRSDATNKGDTGLDKRASAALSDEKLLPETDANCNVRVESLANSASMPVDVDDCD